MINAIKLYEKKEECCGCRACLNICPQKAILMKNDEYGYSYPAIDADKCIHCGLCKIVCAFQSGEEKQGYLDTYVAVSKTTDLKKSASGGLFASIAKRFLQTGGLVAGAALLQDEQYLTPKVLIVDDEKNMHMLLGSKYVQCDMGDVYPEVKNYLIEGRQVLFSGTPCQVAALKRYLKKDYENLFTIDIICHGVPSAQFFQDYIKFKESKYKFKTTGFEFRDKTCGWKMTGKLSYQKKNKAGDIILYGNEESYYSLFLDAKTYRDSCYQCKYACSKRPGDITIGDYWGVAKEHPDVLKVNHGILDSRLGISCMIVNSDKGRTYLDNYSGDFVLYESSFEKAQRHNGQLSHPSVYSKERNDIMELYQEQGYCAVEKWYKSHRSKKYYLNWINNRMPESIKNIIKKIFDFGTIQ